jgi:hypothetical protein
LIDAEQAMLEGRTHIVTADKATFGGHHARMMRYVTVEKQLAARTLRRYRGIVDVHLIPERGRTTPLRSITWERIDDSSISFSTGDLPDASGRRVRDGARGSTKRTDWPRAGRWRCAT